jgi:1-acyl-sn-glycerol-3-phosphate acyltransferase
MFRCHVPPISPEAETCQQEQLLPITVEQLKKLRKPPKYPLHLAILQFAMFLVFGVVKLVIATLYGIIAGCLFMFLCSLWRTLGAPDAYRSSLKLLWSGLSRIFIFLIGIYRINYHGQPDSDCRFLISNHVCFFDSWLFVPFLPRPLDKRELLKLPCIRDVWSVFDGIPVDRTRSTGMTKILLEYASEANLPMIQLFPEGATTNGDYMLRFHLGAFLSDLLIQPATIRYTLWGTSRAIASVSWFHNYPRQLIAFFAIPALTVDIHFLETVSLKSFQETQVRDFADHVSLMIGNVLKIPVYDMTSSAIYKTNVGNRVLKHQE